MNRRWRRAALVVLLLLLAACQASGTTGSANLDPVELPIAGALADVQGKLLYANGGALRTFDLHTATKAQLATFSAGAPDVPVVSPDGSKIAFSLFRPEQGADDPNNGVDLWVMNADGSGQQLVLEHATPGEWLIVGDWARDGQALYFTRRGPDAAPRVERVALDGSRRVVVASNADSPSLSADGRQLAFLTDDPETGAQALVVAPIDNPDERRILSGDGFQALAAPRFAPNANMIAFVGVGGPRGTASGWFIAPPGDPFAWLRPAVASAHGVPWDVWLVNADGSSLVQLTDIQEDAPVATWSPDGQWLGLKGELGLYVVEVSTKNIRRLAQEWVGDGLTWLAP